MTDRRKFITIYLLIVTVISVAVIGLGSWLIVPKASGNGNTPQTPADTSPAFASETYFTGAQQEPALNSIGNTIYADNTTGFTYTLVDSEGKETTGTSKDAGTYYFKITDKTTGQTIASKHEYVIKRAPAVLVDVVSTSSNRTAFYHNESDTLGLKLQILKADEDYTDKNYQNYIDKKGEYTVSVSVKGTFQFTGTKQTCDATISTDGYSDSNIYLVDEEKTFTSLSTHTKKCQVQSIAYKSSTYYATVEAAISGNSSGTVYVLPYATYSDAPSYSKGVRTISSATTISSGLTVTIPYDGTNWDKTDNVGIINAYDDPDNYKKNEVFLKNELTVAGTLNIGGLCHAGGSGSIAGQTVGNYSQLTLESGGKIVVNGTVTTYGFIKGTKNAQDIVFNNGSNLTMPFVLYEFRGGSLSSAMQKEDDTFYTTPFQRFSFVNIDGAYRVNYGTTAKARAALTASSISTTEAASVIGTSDAALVKLVSGSYVDVEYKNDDRLNYTRTATNEDSGSVDNMFGKLKLKFNGGAKLNKLKISKNLLLTQITVSSEGAYLPISYIYDIELTNGSYDLTSQKVKILPGGKITVGDNASVNATSIAVYNTSPLKGGNAPFHYPNVGDSGIEEGKFIVKGTVSTQNFAGKATANGPNAEFKIVQNTTVTDSWDLENVYIYSSIIFEGTQAQIDGYLSQPSIYKTSSYKSDATVYYYVWGDGQGITANGDMHRNGTVTSEEFVARRNYVSGLRPGSTTEYAWSYEYSVTINYVINCSAGQSPPVASRTETVLTSNGITLTDGLLPEMTRNHYIFGGWYLDSNLENPAVTVQENGTKIYATLYNDTTMYAKWIPITYDITYSYESSLEGSESIPPDSVTFDADTSSITLPTPTDTTGQSLTFNGWYTDRAFGNKLGDGGAEIDGAVLAGYVSSDSGKVTLYGLWSSVQHTINFTGVIDLTEIDKTVTIGNDGSITKLVSKAELSNPLPIFTDNSGNQQYFSHWVIVNADGTETVVTDYSFATSTTATTYTLKAVYDDKVAVTFTGDGSYTGVGYYRPNAEMVLPTSTRDGYNFLGWYTAASGGTKIGGAGEVYTPDAVITLYAQWIGYTITYDANGGSCGTASQTYAGTALTLPTPSFPGYKFSGWYTAASGGTKIGIAGDAYTPDADITLYAQWIRVYTISVSTTNANISGVVNGQTAEAGEFITVNVSFTQTENKSFTVTDANGNTIANGSSDGEYTFEMPASNVTIKATSEKKSGSGCVTPDTLITLADGTLVRVDSLKGDELLLVWNLETGTFDFAPIMFVDSEPNEEVEVVRLIFSDGTEVCVIYEHGFWDYDLNKYVYLDENAAEYIGHSFAKQNGDSLERVQLVDVVLEREVTTAWSPVTVGHLCYFVNGMLSMPGGVGGLFNIFDVDSETMTYDYAAIERDIEKYGLYTYEELNALAPLSRDMFEAAGGVYLKISIGKGNLTEEELIYMIERYSKYFE